jgi:enterochelin esterase family protein
MKQRRMYVYTPPGYEKSGKEYPVLYLLHGVFSDEYGWISIGRAVNILDNLIALGKAEPMIVVFTNGNYFQAASPDELQPPDIQIMEGIYRYAGTFEESIVKDIVPFVDANFRTFAISGKRAIAGFSMGGGQATYTALTYPDEFAWVGSFSGAFVVWPGVRPAPDVNDIDLTALDNRVFPHLDSSVNSKLKLLYLTIGSEDPLLEPQYKVRTWLRGKGIHFDDIVTEGYAHVWGYWRLNLVDFTTKIFK